MIPADYESRRRLLTSEQIRAALDLLFSPEWGQDFAATAANDVTGRDRPAHTGRSSSDNALPLKAGSNGADPIAAGRRHNTVNKDAAADGQ